MSEVEVTQADRDAEDRLRAAIELGEVGPDAQLWRHFARHRTASVEAATADLRERLAEARTALEPFGSPDILMQIADDDDEEWAKFRLLVSDYRRAGVSLAKIDALLGEPK